MEQKINPNQFINWYLKIGKWEGYSYLLLLGIAMPLKYVFDLPIWVRVVGMAHGILFIAFIGMLARLFLKCGISFKNAIISFLLSLVPFGSFYLRRWV